LLEFLILERRTKFKSIRKIKKTTKIK